MTRKLTKKAKNYLHETIVKYGSILKIFKDELKKLTKSKKIQRQKLVLAKKQM